MITLFVEQARRLFIKDKELTTVKLELQRAIDEDDEEEFQRQTRGPKRKSWDDLGMRAMRRASEACRKKILVTAAFRQTDPLRIASHCLYRF